MTQSGTLLNPFPGLRPFEPDEDYLFFGREEEVDELLRRLRTHRFLSVVGTSGSGKSSLVRSGLIPSLYGGFMLKAGSSWRVAIMRPGEDPIGRLAAALDGPDVLGAPDERLATTNHVVLDAALRRGTRGLTESVRLAHIPPGDNLLIVVDQFEELFRFKESREIENSRDEAAAFVKLLLEATSQEDVPIYVVITMRADFIGDCMEYHGLPEALNASQYLVPRLTREELRAAITGPVAVGGGDIAPRLVLRLLNDLGNDQDQLPVLQHALMRTWDYWAESPRTRRADRHQALRRGRQPEGGAVAPRRGSLRRGRLRPEGGGEGLQGAHGQGQRSARHSTSLFRRRTRCHRRGTGSRRHSHRRSVPAPGAVVPDAAVRPAARLARDRRPVAREPDAVLDAPHHMGG